MTDKLTEGGKMSGPEAGDQRPKSSRIEQRWVVAALLSLGMVVIHAQRVNLSVSLLAVYDENVEGYIGTNQSQPTRPKTNWSALRISLIHSGFFLGYTVSQIPAGILSYRYSSSRMFGCACLMSSLLNFLIPLSIEKNIYVLTVCVRIFQGLFEGFIWPAAFVLINNWSLPPEKNKLTGCVTAGSFAGAIAGFILAGVVMHYIGWQYIYYGSGLVGVLWWVAYVVLVYDTPEQHPRISQWELAMYKEQKQLTPETTSDIKMYQKVSDFPWRNIMSSSPFLALCSCAFAKGWVFNLLLMQEPSYIHVFGFSIIENGVMCSIPFAMKMITSYSSGFLADCLVNRTFLTRTHVRKAFNTTGFGIEALCLFSLSFIYKGHVAAIVLTLGVMMGGFQVSGWQTNHMDLAPQLAGILVAISQCFSNLAGIFSPLVAGAFIEQSGFMAQSLKSTTASFQVLNTDIYGWHMIFLVAALIDLVCSVAYIIFASGEQQIWACSRHISLQEGDPLAPTSSVSYRSVSADPGMTNPMAGIDQDEETGFINKKLSSPPSTTTSKTDLMSDSKYSAPSGD